MRVHRDRLLAGPESPVDVRQSRPTRASYPRERELQDAISIRDALHRRRGALIAEIEHIERQLREEDAR